MADALRKSNSERGKFRQQQYIIDFFLIEAHKQGNIQSCEERKIAVNFRLKVRPHGGSIL